MPTKKTTKTTTQVFGIGDLVKVPVGIRTFPGKIAEDRGKIGVRGRKLYRIAVMIDGDVVNIELPTDQIRRSGGRVTGKKLLQTAAAVKIKKTKKTV